MRVHFIAIGGSAMHNLAIALSRKGYQVTGSDDEIFEPSASRLKNQGIYPENIGWNQNNITTELDAVILGMHARIDNPELLKAKELTYQSILILNICTNKVKPKNVLLLVVVMVKRRLLPCFYMW